MIYELYCKLQFIIIGDCSTPHSVTCCTDASPCNENEGGCYSNDQCQAGLICDTANDCSSNFGHNFLVHCCQIGQGGTYAFGIM